MKRRIGRLARPHRSAALLVACGSAATTSSAPSAPCRSIGRGACRRASPARASSDPRRRAIPATPRPASRATWRSAGTAASARATPRSRSTVEQQVAEAFNAAHPGIHLSFEGYPYAGARDALSVQIGSGNGPDIVGPVGIGGANAFHGQWLDLQPLIDKNHFDMSQFPTSTVSNLYNVGGEGQVGIPYAIYPSVLFYRASLFKEAGLAEPPHEWNSTYTMPDGSKVPWDYDTVRKIALLLTVDKNGKDATEAGFDPETSSSGASSRSATTCARSARTGRPGPSRPPTARPSRSPTRGRRPGTTSTTASGRTTSR